MTPELLAALLMCLFAPVHGLVSATAVALIAGIQWGLGNRHSEPVLPDWAVRFKRSHANLIENLPSFLGVVLIAHLLHINGPVTALSAWIFVGARLLYVAVYTAGITFLALRTVLYYVSLGAMGTIAWKVLSAI